MAIKHKKYKEALGLLDGKVDKFIANAENNPETADDLAYALKIVINIVYGLTSAHFDNPFRDIRNKDNIVAKRGALFMIDLRHAVQEQGYIPIHIKTDSIKIPNADQKIIDFVFDFGRKYGYEFEHEITYDRFCLINDAVYVACSGGDWTAVGAQFQHPYVFKKLFSKEPIEFDDFCETKNVKQGRMYIDTIGSDDIQEMRLVGSTGSFVPVIDGGTLWRIKDDKKYAVSGTKGYKWIERELAAYRDSIGELHIDMIYFDKLTADAIEALERFEPYERLVL
jgi:hypothetical protein